MKISVVITCYNYGRFLLDAVNSCLTQNCLPFEIVIINDASTDGTRFKCDRLENNYPKFIRCYHNKKNLGCAASKNKGISKTKGDYILLLDADDYLHPDYIEKTSICFDIVSSWVQNVGNLNYIFKPIENPSASFNKKNQITNTTVFKRSIWKSIGGFDTTLSGLEDWDFWLRAVKHGYKVKVIQEVLSYYRHHGESRNKNAIRNYKALSEKIQSK